MPDEPGVRRSPCPSAVRPLREASLRRGPSGACSGRCSRPGRMRRPPERHHSGPRSAFGGQGERAGDCELPGAEQEVRLGETVLIHVVRRPPLGTVARSESQSLQQTVVDRRDHDESAAVQITGMRTHTMLPSPASVTGSSIAVMPPCPAAPSSPRAVVPRRKPRDMDSLDSLHLLAPPSGCGSCMRWVVEGC